MANSSPRTLGGMRLSSPSPAFGRSAWSPKQGPLTTHPSYNDSDSDRTQSHPEFPLLLLSSQSDPSPRPTPSSPALSQLSLLKGSALSPPLTLPPLLDGQHSYHQDELVRTPDMHCDTLRPSELPLSPPAALLPPSCTFRSTSTLGPSRSLTRLPIGHPTSMTTNHSWNLPPALGIVPHSILSPHPYLLRAGWTWDPRPSQNVILLIGRTT